MNITAHILAGMADWSPEMWVGAIVLLITTLWAKWDARQAKKQAVEADKKAVDAGTQAQVADAKASVANDRVSNVSKATDSLRSDLTHVAHSAPAPTAPPAPSALGSQQTAADTYAAFGVTTATPPPSKGA